MTLNLKSKITMIGFVMALLIGSGIWMYLNSASNMIALDVNPSIEIHTNHMGRVVSITPINDDGKKVMAGYKLKHKDIDSVINDIVNRLVFNGYLTTNKNNEILVSSDNGGEADQLIAKVNTTLTKYMTEKKLHVEVLQQKLNVTKEVIKAAHKYNISVGKMAMINKVISVNKDLKVEDLLGASVKELRKYFADAKINNEKLEDDYAISVTPAPTTVPEASPTITETPADQAQVTEAPADQAQVTVAPTEEAQVTEAASNTVEINIISKEKKHKDLEKKKNKEIKEIETDDQDKDINEDKDQKDPDKVYGYEKNKDKEKHTNNGKHKGQIKNETKVKTDKSDEDNKGTEDQDSQNDEDNND